MRRGICMALAAVLLLGGCGSSGGQKDGVTELEDAASETLEEVTIFPKSDCFIGDTMPYFEDGYMNVFYLADQRDGKTGYHPWALMRTKDFCTYEDLGIVIPYGEDTKDQDIALGTGCVMKDQNGLYHAFYTGHNDYFEPKEAIMHATSSDMLTWTKIPADTFVAGDNYSKDDFRDPYVFWVEEEQCYWMLVVTRSKGSGVIARYTSTDLSKWKDEGIFFEDDMGYGTNMECPSLLNYQGTWYLAFSDQWPDRVVHYRVSDSIHGPFKKLDRDTVDSNGFYAGRMETDGENLYLVGWNGTKLGHEDEMDYDWAGNMVVHQLVQQEDGALQAASDEDEVLVPVPNEQVVQKLSHSLPATPTVMTESVTAKDGSYQFAGDQYELVQFDALESDARIEVDVSGYGKEGIFGLAFAPDIDQVGTLNYVLDPKEGRVSFYNTDNLVDTDAQSYMDYDLAGKDSVHLTVLIGGGVASLFVDNQLALTARMYRSQGTAWQLYAVNTAVTWQNVEIYS